MKLLMVKIPVSDIDKVVPFYRDVLGLKEEFIAPQYGWAQFSMGDIPLALYVSGQGGGNGVVGACDSVHLVADDANSFRQRLVDASIDADTFLHTGNDGTVFYELKDPDGNTIKVFIPK